ncbi:TPA: P-type conjugative transfer protein TrbJ [Klebsiella pneumoniae]|uniref:P-type conjugative transfer protein TrbJ n=1 Tax=Klebsiella sp. GG_Kp140 TaxID=3153451 RepID=UPI0032B40E17|nr:P-type conjugative transfer protein TrbJ [Klebsiella pneumoniae]
MKTLPLKLRSGALAFAVALASIGGGVVVAPQPAHAIYCSNCSTVYTQVLEYAEAINTQINTAQQLAQQISMYKDMVKQGLSLDSSLFSSVARDMQKLHNLYQDGRSLAHAMEGLEGKFKTEFPGYDDYLRTAGQSYEQAPDRYKKWSESGFDAARKALQTAGLNTSAFTHEDDVLRQLIGKSSTAAGRMQAIQAGNEIAAQQVQQLQKLREMVAGSITLQANYVAQQTERQAITDAASEKFHTEVPDGINKGF